MKINLYFRGASVTCHVGIKIKGNPPLNNIKIAFGHSTKENSMRNGNTSEMTASNLLGNFLCIINLVMYYNKDFVL